MDRVDIATPPMPRIFVNEVNKVIEVTQAFARGDTPPGSAAMRRA
jgi:hypothetical protein